MKISRLWCQRFFDAPLPPADDLAAMLTARGMEVESVTPFAANHGVSVGRVLRCQPHPNADRLKVCDVAVAEERLQIVCGAPNVADGQTVVVAVPGAQVGELAIGRRSIRGVESAGMICSAAELGVGADDDGILLLGEDAMGRDLAADLFFNDDILDIGITPNRGDCLSHLGIAREIAAAAQLELKPPVAEKFAGHDGIAVRIDPTARDACPYYGGLLLRGVDCARPSPLRLQTLLMRCDERSINPVVDMTNYIMLELGQPLHAFDADKINERIIVRFAKAGEKVQTLDGQELTCDAKTLLIADAKGALALGGIMGGMDSRVTEATVNVLLEAAHFVPTAVRGRTRQYHLVSQAAFRFERGVDATLPPVALTQAAAGIAAVCGGAANAVQSAGAAVAHKPVAIAAARMQKILGIAVGGDEAAALLNDLHLPAKYTAADDTIAVQTPPWRFDIAQPIDLAEEVVRAWGYERLPETLPTGAKPMRRQPLLPFAEGAARAFFAAADFCECISYSFVSAAWEAALSAHTPLPLANPMNLEMAVMRTTLWGGLLDRALFNDRYRQECIRLFEIGRCFVPTAGGGDTGDGDDTVDFTQEKHLAGVVVGQHLPAQWGNRSRLADFYDVKGVVEKFFSYSPKLQFQQLKSAEKEPALHPHKSARIFYDGNPIGAMGELNPTVAIAGEFRHLPLLFSLNLSELSAISANVAFRPVSRFPVVSRDLVVIADSAVTAGQILTCARRAAENTPIFEISLFDFYAGRAGAAVGEGKISYGIRLLMCGEQQNLTKNDIEVFVNSVLSALIADCKVVLRT